MSWWETGNGEDIIGDLPADILQQSLLELTMDCEEPGKPKPKTQDLLAVIMPAWQKAMQPSSAENLSAQDSLVVRFKDGSSFKENFQSVAPLDASNYLLPALQKTFSAVSQAYLDRFGRQPRFRELLSVILFVLRYQPETFLADGESLQTIELQTQ